MDSLFLNYNQCNGKMSFQSGYDSVRMSDYFQKLFRTLDMWCKLALDKVAQWRIQDFPWGGRGPRRRGCGLPRWLRFENFVCQNERIGTLGGGGRAPGVPPLDPPMLRLLISCKFSKLTLELPFVHFKRNDGKE